MGLFDELCSLPPGVVDQRLREVQPDMAAELRRMLEVDATASALDQPPVVKSLDLPERYQDLGLIGRGGMGEVRRVFDTQLSRVVAMKILLEPVAALDARFADEARVVAQLQHPAIVSVHELGRLADGRPYFTMRAVRGEPWSASLARADATTRRDQVYVLLQVSQAVAFAHELGVIHRDLKPGNVVVGPLGDVAVLDWGLARVLAGGQVHSARAATGLGTVMGTPQYMAPEQALGWIEGIGRPTDVYALGAMLYTILAGRPPYGPDCTPATVLAGPPIPLDTHLPAPLVALCDHAMAREPTDRPADAGVFAATLSAWLSGAADRARAEALVSLAQAQGAELARQAEALTALRQHAATVGAVLPLGATIEAKAGFWAAEDAANKAEAALRLAQAERIGLLHTALRLDPDLERARALLADHHRAEVEVSENQRDFVGAALHLAELARFDDGRHAAWRVGETEVVVASDPPGVWVEVQRWSAAERRLQLGPPQTLGPTPALTRLVAGPWRVRLRPPGQAPIELPIFLRREPSLALHADLPGELAPGLCVVLGGGVEVGGDPAAPDAWPRTRVEVPSFVVQRLPVTHRQYIEFIEDLGPGGLAHAPVDAATSTPLYTRDATGRLGLAPDRLDEPVTCVTWHDAVAWCAWQAARSGRPWRLLHEVEWEKAARGPDGRFFPWGDVLDPTFTNMLHTAPDRLRIEPVGARPTDMSPYGVADLGGNARTWCLNIWQAGPPTLDFTLPGNSLSRAVRGGAFQSLPQFCRSATRFAAPPGVRYNTVGFRAGFSLA